MTKYIDLPTVGEVLFEDFMQPFELSQNGLARFINVPPNRIHQILKGTRSVTADTDLRLTKFFGLSEGYFLKIQDAIELKKTKRLIQDELNSIQQIKQALG